jgi:hypothetical protein
LRERRLLIDRGIGRAGYGPQNAHDVVRKLPRRLEIVAEYSDHELAVRAGNHVLHAVDHRL